MDTGLFGRRLAALRKAAGMTQEQLAERLGVSRQQVVRWESGIQGTTQARLSSIFRVLGVTPTQFWDETWRPSKPENGLLNGIERFPTGDWVMVPVVAELRAGLPREVIEETDEKIGVDVSLWGKGDFLWVRVQGDSMIGARIYPGDYVLIRRQPDAENGDIVAADILDEGGTLKRFHKANGSVVLTSENPNYPAMVLAPEKVRIVGVAVEVRRVLR